MIMSTFPNSIHCLRITDIIMFYEYTTRALLGYLEKFESLQGLKCSSKFVTKFSQNDSVVGLATMKYGLSPLGR